MYYIFLKKLVCLRLHDHARFPFPLPDCEIAKLQRVQNAAARLLMSCKKYDHITPVLINLHWLPVRYRINFKILLLTFKALYGMAPSYIIDLIYTKTNTHYLLRSNEGVYLPFFMRFFPKGSQFGPYYTTKSDGQEISTIKWQELKN